MNLPVPGCSISLQAALERMYPAATAARAAEAVTPRQVESGEGVDDLPLFVLDAILPGQSMHLHVFEPRYLALVRRALAQPSRQFGMVAASARAASPSHGLASRHASPCASHGSLVVIEMVSELDGDRLLLEVRATRRFKVPRRTSPHRPRAAPPPRRAAAPPRRRTAAPSTLPVLRAHRACACTVH